MDTQEITNQIMSAWPDEEEQERLATSDEVSELEAETPASDETEGEETETEGEELEETEDEPEEEEEEKEAGEEEETEEEEEELVSAYQTENPQVQAYLSKYQGDVEKALTAAVQLQQVLGRQGQEKAVYARRVQELEQELQRVRTFGAGPALSPEQRTWVDEAADSGNQTAYVQQALDAGEYDLARALCDRWSEEAPYEAGRIAQHVDAAEWQAAQEMQQVQAEGWDRNVLMEALAENFPEMPQYSEQMVSTLTALGDSHPLVMDAKSNDPETAARAVVGIFEIARAQSTSVKQTRTKLQRDGREAADAARAAAVVSSAQATPSSGETPRRKEIMPGLTLEELDAAWDSGK